MAARPDLPLKPRPANVLPKSRRIERVNTQIVEKQLAGFVWESRGGTGSARRAEFMAVGTETSPKHPRR